ncbi:MAG: Glycosyl transferase, group 2 family, partial [uncultured Gemmatimonadetes bacterium]
GRGTVRGAGAGAAGNGDPRLLPAGERLVPAAAGQRGIRDARVRAGGARPRPLAADGLARRPQHLHAGPRLQRGRHHLRERAGAPGAVLSQPRGGGRQRRVQGRDRPGADGHLRPGAHPSHLPEAHPLQGRRGAVPLAPSPQPGGGRQGERGQGRRAERRPEPGHGRAGVRHRRRHADRGRLAAADGRSLPAPQRRGGRRGHHPHRQRVHRRERPRDPGPGAAPVDSRLPGGGVPARLSLRAAGVEPAGRKPDHLRRVRPVRPAGDDGRGRLRARHRGRGHGDRPAAAAQRLREERSAPDRLRPRSRGVDGGTRVPPRAGSAARPLAPRPGRRAVAAPGRDVQPQIRDDGDGGVSLLRHRGADGAGGGVHRAAGAGAGAGDRRHQHALRHPLLPGRLRPGRRADADDAGDGRGLVPALRQLRRPRAARSLGAAGERGLPAADGDLAPAGDLEVPARQQELGGDGAEGIRVRREV